MTHNLSQNKFKNIIESFRIIYIIALYFIYYFNLVLLRRLLTSVK